MKHAFLKGKKGIIFGALDDKSIAWKVAEQCVAEGAEILHARCVAHDLHQALVAHHTSRGARIATATDVLPVL